MHSPKIDAGETLVVIIGAGGQGSELQSYINDLRREGAAIELLGFIDDGRPAGVWNGSEVLGSVERLRTLPREGEPVRFITAIGSNEVRRDLVARLSEMANDQIAPWTLVHPRACIGRAVEIGAGSCIAPGSVVTTNARIGAHCIINVNASVSHDSIVEDFVNINPGAVVAGNVHIGTGAYIGAGATLIHRVKVGEWSVIGAGAVVIDDIPAHSTAVGVPARVIKQDD